MNLDELLKIKGIGKAMLSKLNQNNIFSIDDIINNFPRKYESHFFTEYSQIQLHENVTLKGKVIQPPVVNYIRHHLTKLMVEVEIDSIKIKISVFNREYLKNTLITGTWIVATGKFENHSNQMIASDLILLKNYQLGIIPMYGLEGVSDKYFKKIVLEAMKLSEFPKEDSLPNYLIEKRGLINHEELVTQAHSPQSENDIINVSKRIKYEELLNFGIKIAYLKQQNKQIQSKSKLYDIALVKKFIQSLPFELTEDQKKVTNEIFRDLKRTHPMLRLLQGDVGSGKTVCATIAAYAVVTGGEQVAIMAPTEILAYQHFLTLKPLFIPFGVQVAFLSSNVKGNQRFNIIKGIADGSINIIIGTHSLIQDEIKYAKLGFVIIDEQHRFGVEQRRKLRIKGYEPDVLLMSATPIPRTLSIAIFGDMDISSIKKMPVGRKEVMTKLADLSYLTNVISIVNKELSIGHQAYFIVPLIDNKDTSSLMSIDEIYSEVRSKIPQNYEVAIMHGKLKGDTKTEILNRFALGHISVLISTTVVEVGLNVLNATVMTIINAERFGLSQLHQLRGRVGRSHLQASCFFLSDTVLFDNNRLNILEKTSDGFLISEEDLRQRGPGEVFGSEQTGIPKFKMANIIEDEQLLHEAFEDAKSIIFRTDLQSRQLMKIAQESMEVLQLD